MTLKLKSPDEIISPLGTARSPRHSRTRRRLHQLRIDGARRHIVGREARSDSALGRQAQAACLVEVGERHDTEPASECFHSQVDAATRHLM